MEDGFVKAYSDNLPHVDFHILCALTNTNQSYANVVKHGKSEKVRLILQKQIIGVV
jgi:hypothetical protein